MQNHRLQSACKSVKDDLVATIYFAPDNKPINSKGGNDAEITSEKIDIFLQCYLMYMIRNIYHEFCVANKVIR